MNNRNNNSEHIALRIQKKYLLEQQEQLFKHKYEDLINLTSDFVLNYFAVKGLQYFIVHPLISAGYHQFTNASNFSAKYLDYRQEQDIKYDKFIQSYCPGLKNSKVPSDQHFPMCLEYTLDIPYLDSEEDVAILAHWIGLASWFTKNYLFFAHKLDYTWLTHNGAASSFQANVNTYVPSAKVGLALMKQILLEEKNYRLDEKMRALVNVHNDIDDRHIFDSSNWLKKLLVAATLGEGAILGITHTFLKYALYKSINPYLHKTIMDGVRQYWESIPPSELKKAISIQNKIKILEKNNTRLKQNIKVNAYIRIGLYLLYLGYVITSLIQILMNAAIDKRDYDDVFKQGPAILFNMFNIFYASRGLERALGDRFSQSKLSQNLNSIQSQLNLVLQEYKGNVTVQEGLNLVSSLFVMSIQGDDMLSPKQVSHVTKKLLKTHGCKINSSYTHYGKEIENKITFKINENFDIEPFEAELKTSLIEKRNRQALHQQLEQLTKQIGISTFLLEMQHGMDQLTCKCIFVFAHEQRASIWLNYIKKLALSDEIIQDGYRLIFTTFYTDKTVFENLLHQCKMKADQLKHIDIYPHSTPTNAKELICIPDNHEKQDNTLPNLDNRNPKKTQTTLSSTSTPSTYTLLTNEFSKKTAPLLSKTKPVTRTPSNLFRVDHKGLFGNKTVYNKLSLTTTHLRDQEMLLDIRKKMRNGRIALSRHDDQGLVPVPVNKSIRDLIDGGKFKPDAKFKALGEYGGVRFYAKKREEIIPDENGKPENCIVYDYRGFKNDNHRKRN